MSAAKMVADSTQSELADAMDGKKKKKKMKRTGKKVVLPEDEDSDLDLKKELKPVSAFVKDRPRMIEEMFRAVRGASLQRALPDLLKSIPMDELKQLCLEQLEVMSKKRIRRIMAGEESANISSSGTEDDTSDEEAAQPDDPSQQPADGQAEMDGHPADSTSVHQEHARNDQEGQVEDQLGLLQVKQEPPDSGEEGEGEEQEEEEEEEEPPETYTSGSEDGELVRKEDQQTEDYQGVVVKQEPMSDDEKRGESNMEEGGDDDDDDDADMEDIEGDLMASVQRGSEDGVLPSIMMDQMELLELEMRARAIKAMLSSHADDGAHEDDDDDDDDGGNDDDNVGDDDAGDDDAENDDDDDADGTNDDNDNEDDKNADDNS